MGLNQQIEQHNGRFQQLLIGKSGRLKKLVNTDLNNLIFTIESMNIFRIINREYSS